MNKITPEIINAIKENKLIIFVGSGLSKQFNFPDWKELTCNIITEINLQNPEAGIDSMIPAIKSNIFSPIEVLDKLGKYNPIVLSEICKSFKLTGNENFDKHRKLLELSSKVITTNFDKSFELSNIDIEVIPYKSDFKISQLHDLNRYLFKLHGCIDYPDDCVIYSEQYKKIYNEDSSAFFELKKIISENTILFVGFSLTDPYVKEAFHAIHQMYKGFTRNHFILTTDCTFEVGLKIPSIKSILLNNYDNDFNDILDELISHKQRLLQQEEEPKIETSKNDEIDIIKSTRPSICILIPNPIDKTINYNIDEILDSFNNYDVVINVEYLTIENLRNIKSHDYIIIFTNSLKNKILIEDDFLKSKYISINEIEDNLDTKSTILTAIFYLGDDIEFENKLNTPHVFINLEKGKIKEVIKNFNYKVFTKSDGRIVVNSYSCNFTEIKLTPLSKGSSVKNIVKPNISKYIDQKQLLKFIGRKTDLENIIRKIIENQYTNLLLTIKGSGGIGKTTIITKAAIELAKRKYFNNGIYFISCQKISTFESFKYQISQCFQLINSIELKKQISENTFDKARFIILDNFETILNIQDKEEIIELVSYILDFSTIVATSRQILDLEYEDVYELRNFTTDEGVLLFKSYYSNVKPQEEKVLREQIVEKILNNNPLAIKLIAKGLINSKDLFQLKEELEVNLFKDEDLEKIFENPEDYNIEKSNSLYQSINYSYQSLTDKEKLTFELLSLFPDGIHLENFKTFVSQSKKSKISIGEKEIKSLDNKSLLENTNAFLKLQSIISRFADYQFSLKSESIKKEYYTIAYDYNNFLINILSSSKINQNIALRILDENTSNYLKIVDNLEFVEIDKSDKLIFVNDVIDIFRYTNQQNEILKREKRLYEYFGDVEHSDLFLKTTFHFLDYWTNNFEKPFAEISKLIPISVIDEYSSDDKVLKTTYLNALSIYGNEGFQQEIVNIRLNNTNWTYSISDFLFQLGYVNETFNLKDKKKLSELFLFENKIIRKKLTETEIDKYILTIHPKDTIEIVQITYLKLKCFGDVTKKDIRKLVVTNPFTKGLILLMYALIDCDTNKKKKLFIDSFTNLKHIKYYYIEAILWYCEFLKSVDDKDYTEWIKKGSDLAEKYKYRYLYHKFICLETNLIKEYDQFDYEQIINYDDIKVYINN